MTHVPPETDAWERAGADRKPVASGQQIEREPQLGNDAAESDTASSADEHAPTGGRADSSGAEQGAPPAREARGGDHSTTVGPGTA
jgi:hypothetical protein